MQKNKGLILLAVYLFLAIYLLPVFVRDNSPNELTRWATAVSIVEKASFEIGWTRALIGSNVEAVSVGEKIYSDKAPGTAVIAAPFYALARLFIGEPTTANIRVSWFLMRFFVSTVPLLILAFWLYARDVDEYSLAALLFGSPLFLYSLLFFSHVLAAVSIYFVFRLLYDTERIFLRNCLSAGVLGGFAVSCEYAAVLPALILGGGLYFADRRERLSRLILFAAGLLPFVVVLLVYNYWLFGAPFSAQEISSNTASAVNVSAFGYPTPYKIYLWLFSPAHGLFFFSPVLSFSIAAFLTSRERRTLRHKIKVFCVGLSILILCGYNVSTDDWTMGSRPLILFVPLLLDSFFDGEIEDYPSFWRAFLLSLSIVFCCLPALVFPFAPSDFHFPHKDFWMNLLVGEGRLMPNLAEAFGFAANWWTIVPAIFLLVIVFYTVWRSAKFPAKFFTGILIAAVFFAAYMLMPVSETAQEKVRRFVDQTAHNRR